jgi:hypothetical protein
MGKHKGKRLGDAPRAYVEWLASEKFDPKSKENRLLKNCAQVIVGDKPVAAGVVADDDIPFAWTWA